VTAPPVVSRRRAIAALVVLSIAAFTFVTSEILPYGLISLMAEDLGRTKSQIGLLVTGHALVVMAVSIPLAIATRHVPRRRLLTIALGVFVVASLVAGTSGNYVTLLGARMLTASSQAMFWAVVTATAAGLFPPEVRGRIVGRLLIGPSAGGVLGLPAATWLGQQQGWRAPFLVIACLGVIIAVAIFLLIPHYHPASGAAALGSAPHRRRFFTVLGVTGISVMGGSVTYTYITPYLTEVSGFASTVVPTLLLASGVAGLVSMLAVARYLDRFPRGTMAVGLMIVGIGWAGLAAFGTVRVAATVFFCLVGFGLSVLVGSLANRVMQVSPGSTDVGVATYGSLYNAGAAAGSLLGAGLLASSGPRILPTVGSLLIAAALGLLATEPRFARGRRLKVSQRRW
jgi:predicted MFS family arabinose efflux permease